MTYTASNGVPFTIRLVEKGMGYGRNMALTHESDAPMLEFYDARYPHTEFGQFVSRYYLKTLLYGHPADGDRSGIDLQGDVPDWTIDAETLRIILHDASLMAVDKPI